MAENIVGGCVEIINGWMCSQGWKTKSEPRGMEHIVTGGKQNGFEGVERDDVTESFSYAGG